MIETVLTETLQQAVEGLRPGPDLLARAETGRRRRVRRRAALAGGVGTALLAAGALQLGQPDRPGRPGGNASARPGPGTAGSGAPGSAPAIAPVLPTPVGAAGITFAVRLRNWAERPGRPDQPYADFTGRYDPVARAGAGVNTVDRFRIPVRLIGDRCYRQTNPPSWESCTGTLVDALMLDGGRHWGPSELADVDPQPLLRRVEALGGDVTSRGTTGSGAAAVDRWTFRYPLPADDSVQAHEVTGSVLVQHDSGLLARISWATTVVGPDPAIADGVPLTLRTEITFSDYGVPVDVVAPPVGQITEVRSHVRKTG